MRCHHLDSVTVSLFVFLHLIWQIVTLARRAGLSATKVKTSCCVRTGVCRATKSGQCFNKLQLRTLPFSSKSNCGKDISVGNETFKVKLLVSNWSDVVITEISRTMKSMKSGWGQSSRWTTPNVQGKRQIFSWLRNDKMEIAPIPLKNTQKVGTTF